jgi:hypothetical protein
MGHRHLLRLSSRMRDPSRPDLDITGLRVTGIQSDRDITGMRVTGRGGRTRARIGWRHVITVIAIIPVTGAVNSRAPAHRPHLRNVFFSEEKDK